MSGCADEQVLGALRSFETPRRRLEPVDHALILQIEARGIPGMTLARGPALWLRQTLTIDIHEGERPGPGRARRRVTNDADR